MQATDGEFFRDFRQELLAGADAQGDFLLAEFMRVVTNELIETGFTEGFEFCHYRAQRGMRVDGYWFNDEGVLDLFIADFESRLDLGSLARSEVDVIFKRLSNFFESCATQRFYGELEITSPEYGLARQIADRVKNIRHVNLVMVTERILSDRIQSIDDSVFGNVPTSFHIWDIARLRRQRSSKGHKEPLDLDFRALFGKGIPCLSADLGAGAYRSYLLVIPAPILSQIYGKFGARLLEQNVRTFLQARASVNQGIRTTILNEPGMFFAYNNGITATAQAVEALQTGQGQEITRIVDLQIVNGGQTTASLFHTQKRDKANLEGIFVQMKLSVIEGDQSELLVPRISEYANTQNRVNPADFFSNHAFHIRVEGFSRRLWAPPVAGAQRETKWFYERVRGQYIDSFSKSTGAEQKRFQAEYPKVQMFTKTDLAKFENVWDEHPRWVNLGAQKNFVQYAGRIGAEWLKTPDGFNEFYFRRAISRAIVFRTLERIVSNQTWYKGGYRANIVAYTLSCIGDLAKSRGMSLDFNKIWGEQKITDSLASLLAMIAEWVQEQITRPPVGISNVSEWCKKEACWTNMQSQLPIIESRLGPALAEEFVDVSEEIVQIKAAKKTQKVDDGIDAQKTVFSISPVEWKRLQVELNSRQLLSDKDMGIIGIAVQIPKKIPSEKQCAVLLELLERGRSEGIVVLRNA